MGSHRDYPRQGTAEMRTLRGYLVMLMAVLINVSGCRPKVGKPAIVTGGSLTHSEGTACYSVMAFASGRKGLVIVARSKGSATVLPEMAREGVARIDIDGSITTYPLSREEITHSRAISYFEKAMIERAKTLSSQERSE